jgi:hypothetical protein
MFKIFRKKIQSLNQTQQNIVTVILILFNLAIIIFWINFWVGLKKVPPKIVEKPEEIAEPFKKGEIGELTEEEIKEKNILPLPAQIFNTTGIITKIEKDHLIVKGDGSNFSDKKPRELTLLFTGSTITFESGQKIKYEGLEGLKHLKIGESISISSPENIRGKTQFTVDYINKLLNPK